MGFSVTVCKADGIGQKKWKTYKQAERDEKRKVSNADTHKDGLYGKTQ